MKKQLHHILYLLVCSLTLWACDKDEDMTMARTGTIPALTATQSNLVLEEAQSSRDAVTFTWTTSNFGYAAAVRYTLQFAHPDDATFASARTIVLNNQTVRTVSVGELNVIANEIGLPTFEPAAMLVRIKADISDRFEAVYSDPITLNVTSYLSEPPFATLYMVGSATEFEWDNSKPTPMFRSEEDMFIYTFTGRFKAGDLKFLGEPGKWAPQYGNDGSDGLQFRETDADPDPGAFTIPAEGYYTVTLSLRENSLTIEPYSAAGSPTYPAIGIIGEFNGWSDNLPLLAKSAYNPHFWSKEHTFEADTELKFRIQSGWTVNWGANGEPTSLYGTGGQDRPNLQIPAGTYLILFNDLTGEYLFLEK
ncbi:SusF/SusE family outer membrane protein [Pontibacter qinzhouensis]|uniref:SusF/SusE family outer membrane protein n=1 Tax=Pontibacter qinzhouensis TaxID=2603253 RepID=A0A5C8K875_9BACT|nr:SusE domain-containing protein [Pontibacter qinzhouensis]TXK46104.1 SusF/SusE family outer membrane protein [Pontibacter qinzhouensis]